jgi:hypothetical protein
MQVEDGLGPGGICCIRAVFGVRSGRRGDEVAEGRDGVQIAERGEALEAQREEPVARQQRKIGVGVQVEQAR